MNRVLMVISIAILTLFSYKPDIDYKNVADFYIEDGLPLVDVKINGKESRLLIDTGATSSILDAFSAYEYKYSCNMIGRKYVRGLNGDANIGETDNVNFEINNKKINLTFKCVDLNELGKKMNVLGILGSDFFLENKLIIDYRNLKIKQDYYEKSVLEFRNIYIYYFSGVVFSHTIF